MQENPTNQPNFAINELAGSKLTNLYKLIEQFGKNRITALDLPASTSKAIILHRDLVIISTRPGNNRKSYILSLHNDGIRQSLIIADFRSEGITRTMFFYKTTFQDSIKIARARDPYQPQRSKLSEQEQIAFLNELKEPMIDIKSTRELSTIALHSKQT